jgi:hypothetical protein
MLLILVGEEEMFNDETQEFIQVEQFSLELEHSLASLSKWESKFEKPFLGNSPHTKKETFEYLKMMVVTENVPSEIFERLSRDNLESINEYIDSKQSATIFNEMPNRKSSREIITSELIYYWMVAFTIPFECEHWHLNRLFALIRICGIKNSKDQKMPKDKIARQYRDLNEQRKAKLNTRG